MSEGTFDTVSDGWRAVKGEVVVEEDTPEEGEAVEEETVSDAGRVTTPPESTDVTFTVVRAFTWHGTYFDTGEHTLPEEDYDAMMYDVNLRTDRLVYVKPE